MPIFIESNMNGQAKKRLAVDEAIRKAIGAREGVWRVSVNESADQQEWKLMVRGPNGHHWTQKFGGKDCTPSRLSHMIAEYLEKADAELSIAPDLVKG